MMNPKPGLFLLFIFILSACTNAEMATPAPTQEAIRVFYPPTMQFWADSLANCASNNPKIGLYFFPIYNSVDITRQDIILSLDQAAQGSDHAYLSQVGWDQLVVIVNADNPMSQLSREGVEQIFSGGQSIWMEDQTLPIQVWVLPVDDPFTQVFNNTFMAGYPLTSEAHLAPDAEAMIEAISQNQGAIGFLPKTIFDSTKSIHNEDLKIVSLAARLNTELHLPIVAMTQSEPKGYLRQVLVCLQDTGE
jgi:hypothetical protein